VMTSEERLVAEVAKQLLASNAAIHTRVQIAVSLDTEKLELPALVVSASFESDENGGPAAHYNLTAELRGIGRLHNTEALDEIFREIDTSLLEEAPAAWPSVATSNFDWLCIEAQTGSEDDQDADMRTRSRTYSVFAKLR